MQTVRDLVLLVENNELGGKKTKLLKQFYAKIKQNLVRQKQLAMMSQRFSL